MKHMEEIYEGLHGLDRMLQRRGITLYLKVVGGAALIFNGIDAIATQDIDTITRLEGEIKEICMECSLDINDDALDYISNYEGLEFIHDGSNRFSNISISYLSLGGCIRTKMLDTNPEKLENLRFLLEEILHVEMTVDGIVGYMEELGESIAVQDVEIFLAETEEYGA
jgi:hypothetical protein